MHVLFKQSFLLRMSEYDGSKGGSITHGCGVAYFQAVARPS
jgi:hypothetical protein